MEDDVNIITSKQSNFLKDTKKNNLKPFPITKKLMTYYHQFNDLYHPNKRRMIHKQQSSTKAIFIKNSQDKPWEKYSVISKSNDYELQNVYDLTNKQETDHELKKLYDKQPDESIPNYYASLNLIDLEPRKFDIKDKLYLAPLTTVGNLPFRRICVEYGADITCGEMSLCTNLLKGSRGEWALNRRHKSEKIFGIQLAAGFVDSVCKTLEYTHHKLDFKYDFVDLNVGCPLEEINNKRCGAALMKTPYHLRTLLRGMYAVTNKNDGVYSKGFVPITCKMRKGFMHSDPNARQIVDVLCHDGVSAIGIHGRSRQQRYRRPADWDYIKECVDIRGDRKTKIIGNGDIYNWEEWYDALKKTKCDTIMIARGALIKPWIFKEIKERRVYDISSTERLDIIKKYARYGLERWGSDQRGVDNTRRFLLEWLSFLCRYIPYGILERPVKIHENVKSGVEYIGRDDMETLMKSRNVKDWIKITEIVLGPAGKDFKFTPKHKASAHAPAYFDPKIHKINHLGEIERINGGVGGDNENGDKKDVGGESGVGHKRKLNEI